MAAATSGASPRMAERLRGASRDGCGCGVTPDGAPAGGRPHPRAAAAAAATTAAGLLHAGAVPGATTAAGLLHAGAVPGALEAPPCKKASTSANRASAIVGFVGFVGASSFLNEAQLEAEEAGAAAAGTATGGAATTGGGSVWDVVTGAQPSLTEPPAEAAAVAAAVAAAAADGPPTDRIGPSRVPSQKLKRRPLSPPRRRSVRHTG